jgi:nucleoside-diphosphate-sugar epimerase
MPTFTVAGAAGFIGSHVVEQLRRSGHAVVATDRPGADLALARAAGAKVMEADLADPLGLAKTLEGSDSAINATGLFDLGASLELLTKINIDGARTFTETARSAGVKRLVHLSSVAVYGRPARAPMSEEGPYRPRNPYEQTKLGGELAATGFHGKGIDVAVVRPTLVYGPRSRYGQALFIAMLAQRRALGGRRFPLIGGGPRGHHVHVADVARASILCATHPNAGGRAFNVADQTPLGLGETFGAMLDTTGLVAWPQTESRFLWRLMMLGLEIVPDFALRAFNKGLQRGHDYLVKKGLQPFLSPRLDRDWISYFNGEFVYDTAQLSSLGFTWEHPDLRKSIGGVVDWYRAQGWLPAPKVTPAAPAPVKEASL